MELEAEQEGDEEDHQALDHRYRGDAEDLAEQDLEP